MKTKNEYSVSKKKNNIFKCMFSFHLRGEKELLMTYKENYCVSDHLVVVLSQIISFYCNHSQTHSLLNRVVQKIVLKSTANGPRSEVLSVLLGVANIFSI